MVQLFLLRPIISPYWKEVDDVRLYACLMKLCQVRVFSVPLILCNTDRSRVILKRVTCASFCHPSSDVKMTPNILINDTVLIALLLTRNLHVDVIDIAAAFCLDGAMITDEYSVGLKCTKLSIDDTVSAVARFAMNMTP